MSGHLGGSLYGGALYGGEEQVTLPDTVTDARNDFDTVLDENGSSFSLIKKNRTEDAQGGIHEVTDTVVYIDGITQPVTEKDRELTEVGNIPKGSVRGYFKHEYNQDGTDYVVDTGDELKDGYGREWRVVTIEGRYRVKGFEIYRKVILRRIE